MADLSGSINLGVSGLFSVKGIILALSLFVGKGDCGNFGVSSFVDSLIGKGLLVII
jgi:hypothetical protein